ncbi:BA14K family protein [Kaistia geumhonensis]|uniref:Lectin-like protein BA14k n=1 Tax=Kaistia geumhonensis TaxID=410839 RepID=A0ABU0MC62_9HYPH|nr:BA14K family protein [Kaistia geumhonensis]MCX5481458.1 BA14K family protein [Kaistia geumhonensis]MDQ0518523.1 putative membrane protein [Kaistia geumhonensis]
MKRMISAALAAVIGLGAVAATTSTASADWRGPGWGGPGYGGPGWRGGPGYGPRPGWYGPRPGRWYGPARGAWYGPGWRGNYYGGWVGNPGAAAAAGAILGLGVGAAIASAQNNGGYEVPPPPGVAWQNHVAYCQNRYRSYNPATDSFTGYDGRQYRCVGSY